VGYRNIARGIRDGNTGHGPQFHQKANEINTSTKHDAMVGHPNPRNPEVQVFGASTKLAATVRNPNPEYLILYTLAQCPGR